jgi:polysaccharide biosynthesis/export protein
MKMLYFIRKSIIILAGICLCLFSGCVTQHDLEYMQTKEKNTKAYNEAELPDYKLKPNDELYIQVSSLDEAAANVFANGGVQQSSGGMGLDPYGASLMAYSIDNSGFLFLPVIGKILVKDRTLSQVSSILTDSLSHILSQPMVKVKLVNRYVSVLGYVSTPGHFPLAQDKITIYDALALAGDITVYGNRKEIILTRNENGKNIRMNIDLTSSKILESENYFLRPNDMIYVKPLKKRFWGMSEFPFGIILSTLSVTLLFYSVLK